MFIDNDYLDIAYPLFVEGFFNTIIYCAVAIAIGLPLGAAMALMRLSHRWYLHMPALVFIEVLRNIPFLILVFLIFAALPSLGFSGDPVTLGVIALTAYGVALFGESIRGAILSVPSGQMQAAKALSMSYPRALRRIIFPQMLGYLLPSLTNQIIGQIKESALLSILGVSELSLEADNIVGMTFVATKTYLILALIYWALTAVVAAAMRLLERRVLTLKAGLSAAVPSQAAAHHG
jgi:His/Glu/Gln/Arg/opine family amino acid ABC transporter permease subunit